MKRKVFAIGFNKCGTTSLARFFRRNGYRAAHTTYRQASGRNVNIAREMKRNKEAGDAILKGIHRGVFYSDIEFNSPTGYIGGQFFFRDLAEQHPNARFILNTREKAAWLRSRERHNNGQYVQRAMAGYGVNNVADLISIWSEEWDNHHAAVRAYFADKPRRLLEFNIKEDDISKIVDFLPSYKLDAEHWRAENVTDSKPRQTV